MTLRHLSKINALLAEDDVDSSERIAREMMAEGLSGVADEDTWLLNSRIDHRHFERYDRLRHLGFAS